MNRSMIHHALLTLAVAIPFMLGACSVTTKKEYSGPYTEVKLSYDRGDDWYRGPDSGDLHTYAEFQANLHLTDVKVSRITANDIPIPQLQLGGTSNTLDTTAGWTVIKYDPDAFKAQREIPNEGEIDVRIHLSNDKVLGHTMTVVPPLRVSSPSTVHVLSIKEPWKFLYAVPLPKDTVGVKVRPIDQQQDIAHCTVVPQNGVIALPDSIKSDVRVGNAYHITFTRSIHDVQTAAPYRFRSTSSYSETKLIQITK